VGSADFEHLWTHLRGAVVPCCYELR